MGARLRPKADVQNCYGNCTSVAVTGATPPSPPYGHLLTLSVAATGYFARSLPNQNSN